MLLLLIPLASALLFFAFSYLWVDFGLALMLAHTKPFLENLHSLIAIGNDNRHELANLFLILLFGLFGFQLLFFSPFAKKLNLKPLFITAAATTFIFSFSYPFLSHDIFSYLFSAKMVWTYNVNPYDVVPAEFMANDLWISFTHSVDRLYAYGPVFLGYTLIPMVLFSGSRFILNFFGLKFLNAVVFYLTGVVLFKMLNKDKRVFALWFFNPLLILELLINAHNELLLISLYLLSVFFLYTKRAKGKALAALISSLLVKFVSVLAAPALFLSKEKRRLFFHTGSIALVVFLLVTNIAVQAWYYTWLYMFLPFLTVSGRSWRIIYLANFLVAASYYPFIKFGHWNGPPLIPNLKLWFFLLLLLVVYLEVGLRNLSYLRSLLPPRSLLSQPPRS